MFVYSLWAIQKYLFTRHNNISFQDNVYCMEFILRENVEMWCEFEPRDLLFQKYLCDHLMFIYS